MQWYKIRKEDVSQDLCISEYALEELTPVVRENNESVGIRSIHFQDHTRNRPDQVGEQTGQIGGKLSAIERDAYERGFASGEQAGQELGLKKVEGASQRLKQLLDALNHYKESQFKASEEDILVLVLAVARRVLGRELHQNKEYVTATIRKAIQIIGQNESITIRIHPETLERLGSDCAEMTQLLQEFQNINLEPDGSLTSGECVVESNSRMIDARIESQISIIAQELKAMDSLENDAK